MASALFGIGSTSMNGPCLQLDCGSKIDASDIIYRAEKRGNSQICWG